MATVVGLAMAVLTLPVFFYVGAFLCGELKGKRQSEGEGEVVTGVVCLHTHSATLASAYHVNHICIRVTHTHAHTHTQTLSLIHI